MSNTSTGEQTARATSELADQAGGKAHEVAQSAKAEMRSVAGDVRRQASDVVTTATTELRSQAGEQAKRLSATLQDFGRQLGAMADGGGDPDAEMSRLVRSAADNLAGRARRLDEGGLDGMIDDVKRFARNRPGAFLAGSVALGFAIGRLAKHADLGEVAEHAKEEFDTTSSTDAKPAGTAPNAGTSNAGTSNAGTSNAGTSNAGTTNAGTTNSAMSNAGTSNSTTPNAANPNTGAANTGIPSDTMPAPVPGTDPAPASEVIRP